MTGAGRRLRPGRRDPLPSAARDDDGTGRAREPRCVWAVVVLMAGGDRDESTHARRSTCIHKISPAALPWERPRSFRSSTGSSSSSV